MKTLPSLQINIQNEVVRVYLQYLRCIDNCTDNCTRQLTDIFTKNHKSTYIAHLEEQTIIADAMNNYKKTVSSALDTAREYFKAYSSALEAASELTTRAVLEFASFLNGPYIK